MPEGAIPWRPPKWTQPFCSSRVQQGCEAVFEGVVSGCPHPTVKWTWRGKPLEEFTGKAGRGKMTKHDQKTGKVTLVIENLGPGDEGQYECRADNPYGDSTCTILINPEVTKKSVILPKGSCRPKLKACHIDSDDYADYAALQGL
eukprot:TRINITY_DN21268_c0_g1_i1.p1 TRINITY_DN21268_c0_g1~~TRINITY_DN21268_c0_g1_i1.p1  ORF type:complete len:145 (-),score=39.16 TRINITY_DN21268_c0_g1_i1:104-538(-)